MSDCRALTRAQYLRQLDLLVQLVLLALSEMPSLRGHADHARHAAADHVDVGVLIFDGALDASGTARRGQGQERRVGIDVIADRL